MTNRIAVWIQGSPPTAVFRRWFLVATTGVAIGLRFFRLGALELLDR